MPVMTYTPSHVYILAWLAAGALLFAHSACDLVEVPSPSPTYVVESYQIAGASLQPVYLSRSASLDETYDSEALAVRDARVWIERLAPDSSVEASYPYREKHMEPGVYIPKTLHFTEPLGTYRLQVDLPNSEKRITARTVVPDTFRILSASADTVRYQSSPQLSFFLSPSMHPGREAVYSYQVKPLSPQKEQLTPFVKSLLESENIHELEDVQIPALSLLQESNYRQRRDGTVVVTIPWMAFAFFGSNRLGLRALDDNLYDFLRSQQTQKGGATLAPGEIPDVIDHVDGGVGVFGSYARQYEQVYLEWSDQ